MPPPQDAQWFAKEVQPHEAKLKSYLRSCFPSVRDVDDIVQESYLRVIRSPGLESIRCAKSFLFRVARNVALNTVRRNQISPIKDVGENATARVMDTGRDAAASASFSEVLDALAQALASLPARCQEITVMRKIHGVPQKEIAALLGISEKTVEEQVSRGVKRCALILRSRGFSHFDGA
jgi:RNA polymerase sigma-70 factor (ECF subfamily)